MRDGDSGSELHEAPIGPAALAADAASPGSADAESAPTGPADAERATAEASVAIPRSGAAVRDASGAAARSGRGVGAALAGAVSWCFGAVGLLVALSVLAAIPVLQLLTLGWFLEAEGRVGRGEPWRRALPGAARMSRIGSALVGCFSLWVPVAILGTFARDARLLDPASETTRTLGAVWLVLASAAALHATLAIARGGRLRDFANPPGNALWLVRRLGQGGAARATWGRVRSFAASLRLAHYAALGTKGFVAGFLWLALPCALLAAGHRAPLLGLLGWPLLALAIPWLVVGQARLAAEDRFAAAFELRALRSRLARAPVAHLVALLLLLGLALPLYAFKLEPLPRDARWLPAAFFLVALLPGRLAVGWAYARSRREGRAHWALRGPAALATLAVTGSYVFFTFFTQYFAWSGAPGLFAHHAFLVPVAFH